MTASNRRGRLERLGMAGAGPATLCWQNEDETEGEALARRFGDRPPANVSFVGWLPSSEAEG